MDTKKVFIFANTKKLFINDSKLDLLHSNTCKTISVC